MHPNWKPCKAPSEKSGVTLILVASLVEAREVGKLLASYLAVSAFPTFAKRNMCERFHAHVVAHFNQLAPCLVVTSNIIALGC